MLRETADHFIERHGFGIIAEELYRNISASNPTGCTFFIVPIPEKPQAGLVITDDASERFED